MAKTPTPLPKLKTTLVDQKKKPKGKKVISWGILLKKDSGDEVKVLKKLLASLETIQFKDELKTSELQYQWFKSKEVAQLFNFIVFRQTEKPDGSTPGTILENFDEVPSRTNNPTPPKPPTGVVEIFERDFSLKPV